jgi:predicted transcriptional regulator of viral defense system
MHISEIRKQSPFEELDYLRLKSILRNYSQPRNKIQTLLRTEALIRVKKGIYVFGENVAWGPYCKEHLANLIYGPSAISLEYALSFYGMIPERVEEVTSITLRRNKHFATSVGRFSYRYLSPRKYALGITRCIIAGRNILIATPEKALCDILYLSTYLFKTENSLVQHLYENLRLEKEDIKKLDLELIKSLALQYQHPNIDLFFSYLKEIHERNR